jgi:hypothetical protein
VPPLVTDIIGIGKSGQYAPNAYWPELQVWDIVLATAWGSPEANDSIQAILKTAPNIPSTPWNF